jgi:hypothetical protein
LTQLAKLWAEADENIEVEVGKFSAKHHRILAAAAALEAAASALQSAADASATASASSAAIDSAAAALVSENNAAASESNANADAQTAVDALNAVLQNAVRNYKLVLFNC